MWNYFTKNMNDELEINRVESFYCGDQAGRPRRYNREPDLTADDYMFSINIGLRFYTPEKFFLEEKFFLSETQIDEELIRSVCVPEGTTQ